MPNNRYYYYDHEACSFVEVAPKRRRWYRQAALVLVAAFILGGALAWVFDQGFIGTPQELALKAENEALQQQLTMTEGRMQEFSAQLEELFETDQELYRTLLEAEPISPDVRQVGVGGANAYEQFDRYSDNTADLLQETTATLDQLERQIGLQGASFRELSKLAAVHAVKLAQMPALLPANGPVVSGYGMRRHPILRVRKMHKGIDILVASGSPVVAPGDGIIRETGVSATYGKYVELSHPAMGYMTLFAHLSDVPRHIRRGKAVKRGEQIALSGNTGRSTAPHLHYEVHDRNGQALNPVLFFVPSMTPQRYKKLLESANNAKIALD